MCNERHRAAQGGFIGGEAHARYNQISEGSGPPRALTIKERLDKEIAACGARLEHLHAARQLLEQNPLFEQHQETARALEAAGIYVTR